MEAIGTLAGGIAHDFNNILSAIVGFTELSQLKMPKGSPIEEYIDQVMKAALRAKDLVRQILTFSRLSEQERRPLRVDMVVVEALKLLRASLPMTIEIQQEMESSRLVLADPTQIHQVVMNLCTNAGQAMGEEGGVLELSLKDVHIGGEFAEQHPDLRPGVYLQMTVSDTGPGMPREVLDRIFDPFLQHQGHGRGNRLGALGGARNREKLRRSHLCLQRAGLRLQLQGLSAHHRGGSRGGGGAGLRTAHRQ